MAHTEDLAPDELRGGGSRRRRGGRAQHRGGGGSSRGHGTGSVLLSSEKMKRVMRRKSYDKDNECLFVRMLTDRMLTAYQYLVKYFDEDDIFR